MKKYHILYISIIIGLITLCILKKTNCDKKVVGQTYAQTPQINWTYGIDYETLIPIKELTEKDPELDVFIKNLYAIIDEKDWLKIIQISNKHHYESQLEILGNDTQYIEENIAVYPNWTHKIVIKNDLGEKTDGGFSRLNQIKKLILIGMAPDISDGNTKVFYGYIQKENGIILAVEIRILKNNGKYELTGGVG